jgi:DNA-binding SARP family transcriptional activator
VARSADAPGIQFRILGPLDVIVGGEERAIPGDKLQALLARLLLERNKPVTAERLIDDLWGGEAPATARQSLHGHVARLRRLLATGDDGQVLGNDGRGYILTVDAAQVDAERFRRLVATAREERRAGTFAGARDRYRAALGLWRGHVLDGVRLDGADGERAELEGIHVRLSRSGSTWTSSWGLPRRSSPSSSSSFSTIRCASARGPS